MVIEAGSTRESALLCARISPDWKSSSAQLAARIAGASGIAAFAAGDGAEQVLRVGPYKDFASLEQARKRLQAQKILANPVAE